MPYKASIVGNKLLISPELEYLRVMTDNTLLQSRVAVVKLNRLNVPVLRCASKAIEMQNKLIETQMTYIEDLHAELEKRQ